MSAQPADHLEPVEETAPTRFETKERDTSGDVRPFQLGADDTVLYARRPKMAVLLRITRNLTDTSNPLGAAAAVEDFMDEILTPESRLYLRGRFDDDDDTLDLDDLDEPMQHFLGLWYGRPTGGRAASSGSPTPTGRRSTVRRRS